MKDYINDVAKVKMTLVANEEKCQRILKRATLVGKVELGNDKYELTCVKYKFIDYEKLVVNLIRDKYTIDDELALSREFNMYGPNDEYTDYHNYVEDCKYRAKKFIVERVTLFGK